MAASAEFLAHARDLFAALGPVATRRMFGGAGVFLDDAMFALVADETIWMKADAALAEAYAAAGSVPFTYAARGRVNELGFWTLPETALDDPDEALDWARRSLVPAEAAASAKRGARARKAARKAAGGV